MTLSLLLSSALAPSAFALVDSSGKTVYCGKVEHHHTDACYTTRRTLICGQEETGHHHTDACYATQKKLVCGLAECEAHHHTDACWGDVQVQICTNTDPDHVHGPECFVTERRLLCGRQETDGHTHTAACYVSERVLVCGKEERDGHIHTDACYKSERVLSCGLAEHTHTLECYSNRAAVETEADWRSSVSAAMITGHWSQDLIAVARTQIGYKESTVNYVVRDGVVHGYTRYGDWIDNTESVVYGNWCASFVAFCLYYADIHSVPYSANCATWVKKLIDAGMYYDYGEIEPQPGDLMFIYSGKEADREAHKAYHMGIIVETSDTGFITIEGNVGPVSYREYSYDKAGQILGFCRLPENPNYHTLAGSRGIMSFSGVLPESAEVAIRALSAEEVAGYDLPEGRVVFAFEAKLLSDGKDYKQRGAVEISIEAPGVPQDLQVYHIKENDNGTIKEKYPVEKLTVSGDTVSFIDFSVARYIAIAAAPQDEAQEP